MYKYKYYGFSIHMIHYSFNSTFSLALSNVIESSTRSLTFLWRLKSSESRTTKCHCTKFKKVGSRPANLHNNITSVHVLWAFTRKRKLSCEMTDNNYLQIVLGEWTIYIDIFTQA